MENWEEKYRVIRYIYIYTFLIVTLLMIVVLIHEFLFIPFYSVSKFISRLRNYLVINILLIIGEIKRRCLAWNFENFRFGEIR